MKWGWFLGVLVAASTARADDLDLNAAARRHYDAATAAYNAKDFATAARELEAAYHDDPNPKLLYAWATAERVGGHCDKAIELYRKYLYTDLTPTQADDARKKIAQCEQTLPKPVKHEPPPPPPSPPPPPPEAPRRDYRWYADPTADALTAAGVIGTIVGVAFVVQSSNTAATAGMAPDLPTYYSRLDNATTQRRIGLTALGVGVAAGAAGVYFYIRHGREHRAAIVRSDGRSISIGVRF
jgi:hypothetical protein